jgi:hypothetical protein
VVLVPIPSHEEATAYRLLQVGCWQTYTRRRGG